MNGGDKKGIVAISYTCVGTQALHLKYLSFQDIESFTISKSII